MARRAYGRREAYRESLRENVGIHASIELVKFFPYKVPSDPTADEDIPEVVRLNPEEVEAAQQDADFKTFPRKCHIRKEHLMRHGYTARCPGCMASIQGKRAQGHSRECRQRIGDEMKDHPRVLKAKERFSEALKEYMELDEEKRVTKRSRFDEEGDFEIVRERHHDEENDRGQRVRFRSARQCRTWFATQALKNPTPTGNAFAKMKRRKINP